jgi:hypothetical protein
MNSHVNSLLPKVKANLILTHDEDDELLRTIILSALDYAMTYQKLERVWKKIPPSTEQAVIILSSHFYESRDGGTGGFFADTASAANNVNTAVQRLLEINKERWHI